MWRLYTLCILLSVDVEKINYGINLVSGNITNDGVTYSNEGDVSSPTLIVTSRILVARHPPKTCKQEITAIGAGVKDTFLEACTDNGADSINANGITVWGDPKKLPFCLFSEKPNTLVVVKNKVCTIKTYKTTNGVTTSTKSPMSIGKCSEIKKRMTNALKSGSNKVHQQPSQPAKPPPALPQPQIFPASPITPAIPPFVHPQLFPMTAQLAQNPLLPQPLTSPLATNPSPPVSNPVNSAALEESTASQAVTYRPATNRMNRPFFSKTSNYFNNNGRSTRELIIEGRGVNDCFKDFSQDRDSPRNVITNNILALRDLAGDFALFTDTWGVMWVFVKDQCSKRTYEPANGQTKITSTPLPPAECAVVKDKLTKQMEGVMENNIGGGQPNIPWNLMNINSALAMTDREKYFNERMANWEREFKQRMGMF